MCREPNVRPYLCTCSPFVGAAPDLGYSQVESGLNAPVEDARDGRGQIAHFPPNSAQPPFEGRGGIRSEGRTGGAVVHGGTGAHGQHHREPDNREGATMIQASRGQKAGEKSDGDQPVGRADRAAAE